MIDELLGRSELKARIETLESEREELQADNERLKEQLAAADRRRKDAIRERQQAQEECNRLEDRIAQLEGELDRRSDQEDVVSFRKTEQLQGAAVEEVLDRITTVQTGPEGLLTAAVEKAPGPAVIDAFGDRAALVGRAAPCIAITDDRQLLSLALSPPVMPEAFVDWGDRPQLERSWFRPTGTFTLAVVRSDLFAMGVYRGDERVDYRGFTTDVMSDHSKGGFSQARFERRRDEQIKTHLERCQAALDERTTDRLYLVGEQTALDELAVDATVTDTVDATGAPKSALKTAFAEFWTTQLYLI